MNSLPFAFTNLYRTATNESRYTDLLLQHHAALTAGLIELYSRSLKGHKWAGSPVEEVNGSPSVHRILEELGVIEGEDEAETEAKAGSKFPGAREPVSPLRLKANNISSGPKIKKLPPILQLQVPEKCDKTSPHSRSPLSTASTYANIASANSYSPRDEPRPVRRSTTQCVASPPDSGGVLSRRSSGGTPGPWDSPEFTEELFTTPIPSPTASSPQQDYQYEQQPGGPVYAKPPAAAPMGPRASQAAFDFNPTEMYMREPLVSNSLGMSFPTAATDAETCSAGYFYDATTGGMGAGVYGWDYSTGNSNALGYQDFGGMEYSSWDSGVFV